MAAGFHTSNSTSFWVPVTPSDTVNIRNGDETNYMYIGTTGNLTAICNGNSVLFTNLPVGYHPIKCTKIMATGTTASGIVVAF